MKVTTGDVWVANEVAVKVGGKNYWLFNGMDSDTRFVLAAYLSPARTTRAAATALPMARDKAENPPRQVKTGGPLSYREAVPRAFPTRPVKPVVSKGIRAEINNNLSERLQGTIRDFVFANGKAKPPTCCGIGKISQAGRGDLSRELAT